MPLSRVPSSISTDSTIALTEYAGKMCALVPLVLHPVLDVALPGKLSGIKVCVLGEMSVGLLGGLSAARESADSVVTFTRKRVS